MDHEKQSREYLDAWRTSQAETQKLRDIIAEQQSRLEALCEGTDGSTPAIVRICRLEDALDAERARVRVLRGQLINCVDHLSGARRKSPHVMEHILPVIEQANRVIAATAPEAGEDGK